jgi:2-C-methyl-D-erythritol 4-phosphate cytidylyltransferase
MMKFENFLSVILLAGGRSSRMQSSIPKQFMQLGEKPLVLYSFDVFASLPETLEIIIVCESSYRALFQNKERNLNIRFADPGHRRQDSVYHGFQMSDSKAKYICIHDGARPFVTDKIIYRTLGAAEETGAAAAGVPIKFTVKECHENGLVKKTLNRSNLWEIQTPQIIKPYLLKEGFEKVIEKSLTITDDVSLIELLPHPVKLAEGSYENIKITTPEDFVLAESLLTHLTQNAWYLD